MYIHQANSRLLLLVSGTVMVTLVCWLVFSLQSYQQRARYEVQADGSSTVSKPHEINGEWVVLNVYSHVESEPVDLEMARRFVIRDMQRLAMEDSLVAMLDDLEERFGLSINWE